MQIKREQSEISEVLKETNHHPRILYSVELSFKSEEKKSRIKIFLKQKWREFVASRPALQEMLQVFRDKKNDESEILIYIKEKNQRMK